MKKLFAFLSFFCWLGGSAFDLAAQRGPEWRDLGTKNGVRLSVRYISYRGRVHLNCRLENLTNNIYRVNLRPKFDCARPSGRDPYPAIANQRSLRLGPRRIRDGRNTPMLLIPACRPGDKVNQGIVDWEAISY